MYLGRPQPCPEPYTLQPIRKKLDEEIAGLADRIPAYIHTLPGADARNAVSLFGETDPIKTFRSPV